MMWFLRQIKERPTKKQRVLCAAALWALFLIAIFILRAIYHVTGAGIPCPVYMLSGLLCPGCGMFRAIDAILVLNIWQAVRYNALALSLLPVLVLLLMHKTVMYVRMAPCLPTSRMELVFSISVAAVSMLYAIARNLPFLEMLRPTSV